MKLAAKLKALLGKQKIRFLLVGGFNTVFGYSMFTLMYFWLGSLTGYVITLLAAHLVSSTLAFVLYRRFVFNDDSASASTYLKFQSVYLFPLVSNLVVLPLLVEALNWNVYLAQATFSVGWVFASFFAHKNFTFRTADFRASRRR